VLPTPASFRLAPADALAKTVDHQKEQAARGENRHISIAANGQPVGNYSDPNGTVFIDTESDKGAWAKALREKDDMT
jgi:hypothetical protein